MRALALCALLFAAPVLADEPLVRDQPLMQEVPGGYFVNELGMEELNGQLAVYQADVAKLGAENRSLRASLSDIESRPQLTRTAVILLLVGGAVVGAALGATTVALVKR